MKPWRLEFDELWPFDIRILEGDAEIIQVERVCHSTVQKSLADCRAGIGFPPYVGPRQSKRTTQDEAAQAIAEQECRMQLISAAPEMAEALRDIMKCVEAGVLVRDTSRDAETGWALHQLPLVLSLKAAQAALKKAGIDV